MKFVDDDDDDDLTHLAARTDGYRPIDIVFMAALKKLLMAYVFYNCH